VTSRPWRSVSRWVIVLLVVSTISWRPHVFYAGGLDPIVVAKGLIGLVAIGLAWSARVQRGSGRPMGTTYLWLTIGYLTASTFGAWTLGDLAVAGVLSVRILMLAVAVALLVKTFPAPRLVRDLIVVLLTIALLAVITGAAGYLGGARLRGGFPPLHPNELALMCALPALGLAYLVIQGKARAIHVVLLLIMVGSIWATGSRTSLMALVAGFLVMLAQARRLKSPVAVALACCVPVLVYMILGTELFAEYFARGGTEELTTLNSRSIGWAAAFTYPQTDWNVWLGSGLSVKQVPVEGQYWDEQVLDSSWVSALVHAGWVGVGIMVFWMISVIVRSFGLHRDHRMIVQGLLIYILIRSVLENGLVDSTPTFLALMLISLALDRGNRVDEGTAISGAYRAVPASATRP
jgi:hypothetical protein